MTDDKDDFLAEVREKFERAAEREEDNRARFLECVKFAILLEQWPEAVKKQREDDGRPCLVVSHMHAFIRQVVNGARQNRPSISVIPADSNADPETAEIMSGLIRNIEVSSNADIAYDTGVESAVSGGFGYFRINTSYTSDDTFDQDIVIERIADALTVYGDPDSDSPDGSDWNCAFVVKTMTEDEFEAKYKGKDKVDWDALKELGAPWHEDENVLVAEYWHREDVEGKIYAMSDDSVLSDTDLEERAEELALMGVQPVGEPRIVKRKKVTQYVLSGAEVLETTPWPGKFIPIVPVYGHEIVVEGKRYFKSLVFDAMDSQREHNFMRSAAAEAWALAPKVPFIGPQGAFDTDIEKWSTANHTSHAFIEYDGPVAPQRQGYAGAPIAEMQLAQASVDDMKAIIGLYDPSLGAQANETSGVAIRQRQRQGDIGTFHFVDNLTRSIRQAGRILLDLIPKVYSTSRVIRVLGEDMTPENKQIAPQDEQQMVAQQAMQRGQQIAKIYDLTAGKYDLIVKSGPSFSSQRELAQAEIVEIIRAVPESASVLGPMYLRNSDWPGADDAADKLEGGQQGGDPAQAQAMMQQAQQLAQKLQETMMENRELKQQWALKNKELDIKAKEADNKANEFLVRRLEASAKESEQNARQMAQNASNPYTTEGLA